MAEPIITVQKVSKYYRLYAHDFDRVREIFSGKSHCQQHFALQDINFTVSPGEVVGVVGKNGAGKSTLLKLLANTMQPSAGTLHIKGRVAALLELGASFLVGFSCRALRQGFVQFHEARRQGPKSFARLDIAFAQKHLRSPHGDGAHHIQWVVVMNSVASGADRSQAGVAVVGQTHQHRGSAVSTMFNRVFQQDGSLGDVIWP